MRRDLAGDVLFVTGIGVSNSMSVESLGLMERGKRRREGTGGDLPLVHLRGGLCSGPEARYVPGGRVRCGVVPCRDVHRGAGRDGGFVLLEVAFLL